MKVKIKRLDEAAKKPTYATAGSACFDLYSITEHRTVMPSSPQTVKTGLAFEIPEGNVMLIFSRSGHGFNFGTRLANCVGVIDSDYRGEVLVKLTSDERGRPLHVNKGDRVAQALVIQIEQVEFFFADELSETARSGGFGSTGQ